MSSRTARTCVVAFLLVVAAAAGYLGFDTARRHEAVLTGEHDILARLDAMVASVNELAVTQRGYFETRTEGNGGSDPQYQRVRQLTDELKEHLAALRSQLSSPEAIEQTATLATALDDFATTDTRVRTNLANDTYFSAADLVFSASANELRAVTSALTALKAIAMGNAGSEYRSLQQRLVTIAATVGVVWLIGLFVLAKPPSEPKTLSLSDLSGAPAPAGEVPSAPPVLVATETRPPAVSSSTVDLEAAARVCTALASAASATALREILADAASTANVTGMVVWLGAGEELFPVLGHGYDPRMLGRIGPIARQAANATATAWRTSNVQIVPGEEGRPGAIVVPLVSSQGCIGVLSAELASGRERDVSVRSIISLYAAQLSAIVAAWPEPSAGAADTLASPTGSIAVTL